MNRVKLAELITTFFYIGKIKYCPGTFGSIAGYLLVFLSLIIAQNCAIRIAPDDFPAYVTSFLFIFIIILILKFILLFSLGVYFSNVYINYTGRKDPKEIVIDEVLGQLLTTVLCIPALLFSYDTNYMIQALALLNPFILFRLFDILKPWPINWIDQNIKGGLGVMLDDILAAIFAIVINYAIILLFV